MPTYVLVTKLSPTAMKDPRGRKRAGQEWKDKVEKLVPGLHWKAHYALLGPYDFMDVYDAPDDAAAMRVSLLSRELGAASAESWPAMAYDSFLPLVEQVEKA
ncbi:MAG TPA: GYD domain-containing protein [Polyangiaceae bacterium]